MNIRVDLSSYDNSWYSPGGGFLKSALWYFTNLIFVRNRYNIFSLMKVNVLKVFGAKIGKHCVIKPGVNIKYPWRLEIGDNVWIGEDVWIDNLADVKIGNNCCISQGAMLLCGNHDYKKSKFDLIIGKIVIEDGSWVGAKAILCPNVIMHTHSMLSVGSVASGVLDYYCIYKGNPAVKVKERRILF